MIEPDENFDGTFPFAPHFSEAPGFRMHYIDEGAGPPIICLHGEPTWGYLYRKFVRPLAETNRVVVPDHMGFGKSETPQDREYTLRTHVGNLTVLIDDLELTDITFVAQDWGGPIAGAYTVRHPDRVKRLCLMNTVCGYGLIGRDDVPPTTGSRWFRWIAEGYDSGRTEAVLTNLGSTVVDVMKILGFENSSEIDDTWIRAYSAPFPTPEECKGALEFPLDPSRADRQLSRRGHRRGRCAQVEAGDARCRDEGSRHSARAGDCRLHGAVARGSSCQASQRRALLPGGRAANAGWFDPASSCR